MKLSTILTCVTSIFVVSSVAFAGTDSCRRFYSENPYERRASDLSIIVDFIAAAARGVDHTSDPKDEAIHRTLPHLQKMFGDKITVPEWIDVEVTTGQDPLSAFALPLKNRVSFDESLFQQSQPFRDGIFGHEIGHLYFQSSMKAEIKKRFPVQGQWRDFSMNFTDQNFLKNEIQNYERNFPLLRKIKEKDIAVEGVTFQQLAMYRTYKIMYDRLLESRPMSAQESLDLFILKQMAGFHEVFGDFIGAVFARNPSWSQDTFSSKASRDLRDFNMNIETVLDPEVRAELARHAQGDIPHLLLFKMRARITENYYRSEGRSLGRDWTYDSEISKMIVESMFESSVPYIIVVPPSPKPNAGSASNHLVAFLSKVVPVFDEVLKKKKTENLAFFEFRRREREIYNSLLNRRIEPILEEGNQQDSLEPKPKRRGSNVLIGNERQREL